METSSFQNTVFQKCLRWTLSKIITNFRAIHHYHKHKVLEVKGLIKGQVPIRIPHMKAESIPNTELGFSIRTWKIIPLDLESEPENKAFIYII
jgi:hypothetical protein